MQSSVEFLDLTAPSARDKESGLAMSAALGTERGVASVQFIGSTGELHPAERHL